MKQIRIALTLVFIAATLPLFLYAQSSERASGRLVKQNSDAWFSKIVRNIPSGWAHITIEDKKLEDDEGHLLSFVDGGMALQGGINESEHWSRKGSFPTIVQSTTREGKRDHTILHDVRVSDEGIYVTQTGGSTEVEPVLLDSVSNLCIGFQLYVAMAAVPFRTDKTTELNLLYPNGTRFRKFTATVESLDVIENQGKDRQAYLVVATSNGDIRRVWVTEKREILRIELGEHTRFERTDEKSATAAKKK